MTIRTLDVGADKNLDGRNPVGHQSGAGSAGNSLLFVGAAIVFDAVARNSSRFAVRKSTNSDSDVVVGIGNKASAGYGEARQRTTARSECSIRRGD